MTAKSTSEDDATWTRRERIASALTNIYERQAELLNVMESGQEKYKKKLDERSRKASQARWRRGRDRSTQVRNASSKGYIGCGAREWEQATTAPVRGAWGQNDGRTATRMGESGSSYLRLVWSADDTDLLEEWERELERQREEREQAEAWLAWSEE